MNAIVLTFDRNAVLTQHMITCYRELWPDHPFIFRIPFQNPDRCSLSSDSEYRPTPADIRNTVLQLLMDLPDDEWIYWCIDDRYPVFLDTSSLSHFIRMLNQENDRTISGLLFCRAATMHRENQLTGASLERWGLTLLERKKYYRIWVHQFVRVKVIRTMFLGFPEVIGRAGLMDPMKNNLIRPADHQLYVTGQDYAHFEESSINGVLTERCLTSLMAHGFEIPQWFRGKTTPNPDLG